jgi:hypothetical protein
MFREQIVNFLEAAIVFLLLTNALTAAAATWAIAMVRAITSEQGEGTTAIARRIHALFRLVS